MSRKTFAGGASRGQAEACSWRKGECDQESSGSEGLSPKLWVKCASHVKCEQERIAGNRGPQQELHMHAREEGVNDSAGMGASAAEAWEAD